MDKRVISAHIWRINVLEQVDQQQNRQMFTGFWDCYLQTDGENSALSSELPLFPELETSQVSDSIRCGLEVKIVEPKNASHTVQDQLLFPVKLPIRVPISSELLCVQRSEPHFLQLLSVFLKFVAIWLLCFPAASLSLLPFCVLYNSHITPQWLV